MTAPRENRDDLVYGAHPVGELLRADPGRVERVFVSREASRRHGRILREARTGGVPVSYLPAAVLKKKLGNRAVHQGIAAQVAGVAYVDPEELIRSARRFPDPILLLLDRVEDPRNLGAILRTAAAAGVRGTILSEDATVGITPAAIKASAGVAARVQVARTSRPGRLLAGLGSLGFRVVALDPRSDEPWDAVDWTGPTVIVAGGEARGPRPGVLEGCNVRVAIPLEGGVDSLNVSVAVGLVLFEAVRQRRAGRKAAQG